MKRKTKFGRVIFALSLGCATTLNCAALGQASAEPPVQLTSFSHSAALKGSGIGLTQIGSKGFFYAQVSVDYSLTNAIERISFDGTDVTSYSLDRMIRPTYLSGRSPFIESFIAGSDGSVDILAHSPLLVGWEGDTFYFLHDAKRNGKPFGFEIEKATP